MNYDTKKSTYHAYPNMRPSEHLLVSTGLVEYFVPVVIHRVHVRFAPKHSGTINRYDLVEDFVALSEFRDRLLAHWDDLIVNNDAASHRN